MEILAKIAAVCATTAGTYAAFKALEESASPASRVTLSAWLRKTSLAKDHTAKLHDVLETTFVSTFGSDPFQQKFFIRSLLLSAIATPVSIVLYYVILKLAVADSAAFLSGQFESITDAVINGPLIFVVAVVSDYLSLLKTSLIVQCVHFRRNPFKFYIADLVLSAFIAGGWLFLLAFGTVIYAMLAQRPEIMPQIANHAAGMFAALLSALFPTVVALLYILSTVFARVIVLVGRPLDALRAHVLDIDSKPFLSVGILVLPLVAILAALVVAIL
jgi:hypothetical protein